MEKNISKLFDRYKKSQDLLDHLSVNSTNPGQPISQYPQNEFSHTSFQSKLKLHQLRQLDDSDSSSREKTKHKKSYQQTEQISRLKDTIWLKENQDRERTDKIGLVNRELKIQLKETLDRLKDSERKSNKIEELLRQYEEEAKLQQENVLQYNKYLRENKLKEESQNRLIDEIKQSYLQQKSKMAKKKAKLTQLKLLLKQQESQSNQQTQHYNAELGSVQQLCEDFSNEIKQQESRNSELEHELRRIVDISDRKDEIIHDLECNLQGFNDREKENHHQIEGEQGRANDYKSRLEQIEIRFEQVQNELKQAHLQRDAELQRYEDEMRRLTSYYDSEVEKKKHKILEMKNIGGETELKIQQHLKDIDRLKKDLELQEQVIGQLQDYKKTQESIMRDLEQKYYKIQMELNDEKSNNLIKEKKQDEDKQIDFRQIQELKDHINNLRDSYQQLQAYSTNMERQVQLEKFEQDQNMNDIEKQIDQLVSQLNIAQAENQTLKNKENGTKKQDEEVVKKYKYKLEKAKSTTELLKIQLKNVEDKLRFQDSEKHHVQQEALKIRSQQSVQEQHVKNKLKAIDDIQAMIQSHKQHSLHF